jgi:hypothetical protein
MAAAEFLPLEFEGLLEERDGPIPPMSRPIPRCQVVHGRERLGVVGAELPLYLPQGLLEQRQGQVELAGDPVGHGETILGVQRPFLVSPQHLPPQGDAALQVGHGPGRIAQATVVDPDDPVQLRLCRRVQVPPLAQLRGGPVQQLPQRGVLGQSRVTRPVAESVLALDAGQRQEVVADEAGDRLGVLPLLLLVLAGRSLGVLGLDGLIEGGRTGTQCAVQRYRSSAGATPARQLVRSSR